MILIPLFAVIVGVGMLGQWTFLYLSHQIPELETEPIRIRFHIAAEAAAALTLIAGGIGLFLSASWGTPVFLVGAGMLFYTAIVSPGYFAQQGQWGWLVMFALLIAGGLACIAVLV
ncbi:MAG: hypothetical protein JXA25_12405 [Anaerolineales bacterium]|nr:hypothetical protein [Anaerolineales bacterium]